MGVCMLFMLSYKIFYFASILFIVFKNCPPLSQRTIKYKKAEKPHIKFKRGKECCKLIKRQEECFQGATQPHGFMLLCASQARPQSHVFTPFQKAVFLQKKDDTPWLSC